MKRKRIPHTREARRHDQGLHPDRPGSRVERNVNVRPRAWLGHGVITGQPFATVDETTCSDACGPFVPLYAPDDFVADVIGIDNMRELCALLVDLDNIEDPERVPFPAIEDRDWRAHAGKCSRALRMLMRRIVGSGPDVSLARVAE